MSFFSAARIAPLFCAAVLAAPAHSDPAKDKHGAENLPDEIITASPLSPFSDRAALWPSREFEDPPSESKPLADILNEIPGIQARDSGSPTVSIRGSASADRVLKLYEGIPLNLGDGLGASKLFLPNEALGSIDVIKGPASAYYGSSAMAGAIDHRTRIFNQPVARIHYADAGGFQDEQSVFAAAPLIVKPTENQFGQISANYSHRPGRYPYSIARGSGVRSSNNDETSRLSGIGQIKNGALTTKPVLIAVKSVGETPGPITQPYPSTYSYEGTLLGAEAIYSIDETRRISTRLSDVRQWGLFDRGTTNETTSLTAQSALSLDARMPLADRLTSRSFIDSRADTLTASYLGSAAKAELDVEVGEGLEIALTSSLALQPVVRYMPSSGDHVKAIGLLKSDSTGRQWLTYAEGFRRPSLTDRFANVSYFRGNPQLKPERSRSVDFGFDTAPNEKEREGFSLSSTLFIVRYDDLIDTANLAPSVSTKINTGRALAQGAEIETRYQIGFIESSLSLGLLDARNEDTGEPLRLSPKNQTRVALTRRADSWRGTLSCTNWSSFYDRDTATNNLVELPSWTTVDFDFRSFGRGGWEFGFGVQNLFDRSFELTIGYPEKQRRVYLSVLRYL